MLQNSDSEDIGNYSERDTPSYLIESLFSSTLNVGTLKFDSNQDQLILATALPNSIKINNLSAQRLFSIFSGLINNELKQLESSKSLKILKLKILTKLPFTAIKKDIQIYLDLISEVIQGYPEFSSDSQLVSKKSPCLYIQLLSMEILSNLPEEFTKQMFARFEFIPVKLLEYLIAHQSDTELQRSSKLLILVGNSAELKPSLDAEVGKTVRPFLHFLTPIDHKTTQ